MRFALIVMLAACSKSPAAPAVDGNPGAGDARADAPVDEAGPGPTQACPFTADADGFFTRTTAASDYVIRLPVGYDVAAPRPTALLVAIHGCGDSAMNFATWGAVPYALRATQDYLAISIGGRDGMCWDLGTDVPTVQAAIADVRSCFYVHQKRIVVAGYSSGGMMAYKMGMTDAAHFAGILIENSGLYAAGLGNEDTALDAVAWKLNVAHTAHLDDQSFLIDQVRGDKTKMLAHGIPLVYREQPGTHDGTSDDWAQYLIPAMATWHAP